MSITDAKPLLPENVTNLFVEFSEVWVHKSGEGWAQLPLAQSPCTIDMLEFQDGNTTELVPPAVITAGAFGNYIHVGSAVTIGMLPDIPVDRFAQIGNAAGIGAKLALVSHQYRSEAESIANTCNYIELSGSPAFNTAFMKAMRYPEIKIQQPREALV